MTDQDQDHDHDRATLTDVSADDFGACPFCGADPSALSDDDLGARCDGCGARLSRIDGWDRTAAGTGPRD